MSGIRPASLWFTRLFAGAVVAHIAGNPPFGYDIRGVVTLVLGLVAVTAIVHPSNRYVRVAMNALVLVTVWLEAPVIGNHWLLAGVISLVALIAETQGFWFIRFRPVAQGTTLIFYGFAAFAKLNEGFFDAAASCSTFYVNQSLSSWNLGQVPTGGGLATGIAVATAAVELSIPVLVVLRRTRPWGVTLAYVFHFLISLDLGQHFYDFTALLFALFSLFVADGVLADFEAAARRYRKAVTTIAVIAVIVVVSATYPSTTLNQDIVRNWSFALWVPVGAVLVAGMIRHGRSEPGPLVVRSAGPLGILIMALVFFNGLTPYLGVKSATSFNMYSNLLILEGESNHFIVRRTPELVDVHYVEIVDAESSDLRQYIDSGYLVPERNLLDHLASHPAEVVTYERGGEQISGSGLELGEPMPTFVRKFALFRSIDTQRPPRCQAVWLPAS